LMLMERYENIEKISVVLDVNKMIMESIYAIYRLVIESDSVKLADCSTFCN